MASQFERERQWKERWAALREENSERLFKHRERQNLLMEMQLHHFPEQQKQKETDNESFTGQKEWLLWPLGRAQEGPQEGPELPMPATLQSDLLTEEQQLLQQQWRQQHQQFQKR